MKSHLATLTATALIGLGVFEPDAAEIRVERIFGPETKMVPKLVAVPKGQKINAVHSNRITMMLQPGHPDADESGMVRYFREEMPTGRYKHPTSIDQLANGDLYLVYYGGEGEYADGTAVYGSRLVKGREKWSPPEQIAEHPVHHRDQRREHDQHAADIDRELDPISRPEADRIEQIGPGTLRAHLEFAVDGFLLRKEDFRRDQRSGCR